MSYVPRHTDAIYPYVIHEEPPSQAAPCFEFSVDPSADRFKETSRAGKAGGGTTGVFLIGTA